MSADSLRNSWGQDVDVGDHYSANNLRLRLEQWHKQGLTIGQRSALLSCSGFCMKCEFIINTMRNSFIFLFLFFFLFISEVDRVQ